ncbi:hypothetical protein ABI59_11270 [Acidobacteria bacterium Mor1]|nr:hypothetical protein ABI59_11270 [Acidobacteria bacterium Mor1]
MGMAALLALAATSSVTLAQETWIIGEGSGSLWVFDPVQQVIVDEVALPERIGSATDLTLSTVPGHRHDEVFVASGSRLIRFDRISRAPVELLDLNALLDAPATIRDMFAGLPATDTEGHARTLLYVLADVATKGGKGAKQGHATPQIIVFDQEVLTELATGALIVDVEPVPSGEPGAWTGSGISVADAPGAPDSPRVWATIRNQTQPAQIEAHRFTLSAAWTLAPVESRSFALAADAVDEMRAAVVADHDDALLPLPGQGTLLNLTGDGSCVFDGRMDAGALSGPAGGFTFIGIDATGTRALRFNAGTCDAAGYPLEFRPTAISLVRSDAPSDAIISHRDDDRISMLKPSGEVDSILLGSGKPGKCQICPGESETAFDGGGGGCPINITGASDIAPVGPSQWSVAWQAPGCDPGFDVWCTCLDTSNPNCFSCYCPTPQTKGCIFPDWSVQNSADFIPSTPGSNGPPMPLGPNSSPWKHLGLTYGGGGPNYVYTDPTKNALERILYAITGVYWE